MVHGQTHRVVRVEMLNFLLIEFACITQVQTLVIMNSEMYQQLVRTQVASTLQMELREQWVYLTLRG